MRFQNEGGDLWPNGLQCVVDAFRVRQACIQLVFAHGDEQCVTGVPIHRFYRRSRQTATDQGELREAGSRGWSAERRPTFSKACWCLAR